MNKFTVSLYSNCLHWSRNYFRQY